MNTRKHTLVASLSSLAALLAVTSAMAAAGSTPLSDCYDRVIASCNQGNHPVPCAENGMDQCDEEFGASIYVGDLNKLKNPGRTAPLGMGLVFVAR